MKSTIIIFLFAIVLVSGCDSVNWQQYQITAVTAGSPDAVRLKSVLQTFAAQVGMDDKTSRSHVTNTLCYYIQQPRDYYCVFLGARFYQTNVLVDLGADFGPTPPEYNEAKKLLMPALTNQFGSRVSIPQPFISTR